MQIYADLVIFFLKFKNIEFEFLAQVVKLHLQIWMILFLVLLHECVHSMKFLSHLKYILAFKTSFGLSYDFSWVCFLIFLTILPGTKSPLQLSSSDPCIPCTGWKCKIFCLRDIIFPLWNFRFWDRVSYLGKHLFTAVVPSESAVGSPTSDRGLSNFTLCIMLVFFLLDRPTEVEYWLIRIEIIVLPLHTEGPDLITWLLRRNRFCMAHSAKTHV